MGWGALSSFFFPFTFFSFPVVIMLLFVFDMVI
jgi:hypothetical protein